MKKGEDQLEEGEVEDLVKCLFAESDLDFDLQIDIAGNLFKLKFK